MKLLSFVMFAALAACVSAPPPDLRTAPRVESDAFVVRDGARLAFEIWPAENPRAIVIGLHGMNDYGHSFALPGEWLAANAGITTYGLDQRGFGRSPDPGRWPGEAALVSDLLDVIAAVRAQHPKAPVFLVGHSMGAAVVLAAANGRMLDVDGVILAAPGVWGGSQLPILYRMSLNIAAAFAPGKTLTGERTGRQSTDNIELLREMYHDPHVIKATRIDAIQGVVRVMGEGYSVSDAVGGDILFLYGEKDEIIPVKAMAKTAARLCGDVSVRTYADGWHLLLRDLQAENVWRDIASWIDARLEKRNAAAPKLRFGPAASVCVGAGQD